MGVEDACVFEMRAARALIQEERQFVTDAVAQAVGGRGEEEEYECVRPVVGCVRGQSGNPALLPPLDQSIPFLPSTAHR